jgi:ubiquinone/menaquinone biosynthesis C-methylase UbiE
VTHRDHDSLVRRQFGASAPNYRTSPSHARGRSLSRLVELAVPRPDWLVLDVATGAGHTAATLAPHVRTVIAGDMTGEMLAQAGMVSREKGLGNVLLVRESAQALSYRDHVFDLVACRIAAHHFPDPARFVAEGVRVLKPGGILALIDNVVPADQASAAWINDFERKRDPSHVRCLSPAQWREMFVHSGLSVIHEEVRPKVFDYQDWMSRMNVEPARIELLSEELFRAPQSVQRFLNPQRTNAHIMLALQELILLGRSPH